MTTRERAVATEILSTICGAQDEPAWESGDVVRFRVRKQFGWRLGSVVFSRRALAHLAADPDAAVKIEYLQRELRDALTKRREFRYPRRMDSIEPSSCISLATVR